MFYFIYRDLNNNNLADIESSMFTGIHNCLEMWVKKLYGIWIDVEKISALNEQWAFYNAHILVWKKNIKNMQRLIVCVLR